MFAKLIRLFRLALFALDPRKDAKQRALELKRQAVQDAIAAIDRKLQQFATAAVELSIEGQIGQALREAKVERLRIIRGAIEEAEQSISLGELPPVEANEWKAELMGEALRLIVADMRPPG